MHFVKQLDSEVALLIKERDLKLNWFSPKNEGGRGCYRANKRRRGLNENRTVFSNDCVSDDISRPVCSEEVVPATCSMIIQGACLPSMVTWWIPPLRTRHEQSMASDFMLKSRRRRSADSRVANPGSGKRGRDKRCARQFRFKWEVIKTYESYRLLKAEGKVEDPCLITAKLFNINKSQVSSWYKQREMIRDKLGELGAINMPMETELGQDLNSASVERSSNPFSISRQI
uniref:Uncharacterized protein n=1 Tax=Hanusia phi TaxID=3032 RepID=A0A7S0HV17_9CRYP|mmetsp:Transcript_34714/g.78383  ORF Transcript_34714/g.78383 Transcript_34714/m.78383 type:complete len:230 (+) Transcript_34714:27-716(+)